MPELGELHALDDRLNHQWWGGRLPKTPVRWSKRMHATAGKYWRAMSGWEIVLSIPYHAHYPNEVQGTLLHEMIHVWIRNRGKRRYGVMHGPEFRAEAKRIGAPLHCRSYEGMHRPYQYERECPC